MATLAEIRSKLQQAAQQSTGNSGDNQIYAHWNIAEGQTATVRFLPDSDTNNTFFWVERALIKLPFSGVAGDTASRPVTVQVPCMEMWGETCPILTEVRPWYKDESLKEMAGTYWKKRSYLFQGFVVDSKYQEESVPENPIRRFIIGAQIFNIIKDAIMDPEIDENPTDSVRGLDFKINKTSKGGYADYSTSTWSRRERSLNEAERAAIDQYGLFDLKNFLPKKPTAVELKVIKEMFEASVDGEAFDMDRWGQHFKPAGMGGTGSATGAPEATYVPTARPTPAKSSSVATTDGDEDFVSPDASFDKPAKSESPSAGSRAADILAAIKSRKNTQE
jgi:hypothetical protein